MIVIDTNLLVYAHRSRVPEHRAARGVLERASRHEGGWALTLLNVLEFWSVVTHPAASGRPSRPAEARDFVESLTAAGARILQPTAGTASRLLDAATEQRVSGARVFDLLIALIARDHGATEIWSHDRGFLSLSGLPVLDPIDGP